jgi:hypothetical protein
MYALGDPLEQQFRWLERRRTVLASLGRFNSRDAIRDAATWICSKRLKTDEALREIARRRQSKASRRGVDRSAYLHAEIKKLVARRRVEWSMTDQQVERALVGVAI